MSINWTKLYLDTFQPEIPNILNNNFTAVQRYLNIFYDASNGIMLSPVNTSGLVKGSKGEFVTMVADNVIVRNQFTNLYENTTTVDGDFYNTYVGVDTSTRIADASTFENVNFSYIDVNKPYYKISNDASLAFLTGTLGQEFQLIFDPSMSIAGPYTVLMDPSNNGSIKTLSVDHADASTTWIKLISIGYDVSWGTSYTVKQYGGTYSIN